LIETTADAPLEQALGRLVFALLGIRASVAGRGVAAGAATGLDDDGAFGRRDTVLA
jgi:hypothetical protein